VDDASFKAQNIDNILGLLFGDCGGLIEAV